MTVIIIMKWHFKLIYILDSINNRILFSTIHQNPILFFVLQKTISLIYYKTKDISYQKKIIIIIIIIIMDKKEN